jgi:hypothetical protein
MMIGLTETCSVWKIIINTGCVGRNTQCYLRKSLRPVILDFKDALGLSILLWSRPITTSARMMSVIKQWKTMLCHYFHMFSPFKVEYPICFARQKYGALLETLRNPQIYPVSFPVAFYAAYDLFPVTRNRVRSDCGYSRPNANCLLQVSSIIQFLWADIVFHIFAHT